MGSVVSTRRSWVQLYLRTKDTGLTGRRSAIRDMVFRIRSNEERATAMAVRAVVLLILIAAFALRYLGTDFCEPTYVCHPDEPDIVERAVHILNSGDFNPRWYHYPTGYLYTQALVYIGYLALGASSGHPSQLPIEVLPRLYYVGRLATVMFGTLTVFIIYLIARKGFGARIGVIAAAFSAFSYLSVIHSHYITPDMPATFWVAMSTLFSLLILQRGETKWYVLAGVAAGLAATTKYNAGLVAILIPAAHVLGTSWDEWGFLDRRLVYSFIAMVGGFLLGTPYAILDLPTFLNGVLFDLYHYATYHLGYSGNSGSWYLRAVFASADAPLGAMYIAGVLYSLKQLSRRKVLLLLFPIFYYIVLARAEVHFERNMLPLIPAVTVLGAVALDATAVFVATRANANTMTGRFVAGFTALVVALPLVAALLFGISITRQDMRPAAAVWMTQNLPPGSRIATEHYQVPFDSDAYDVTDILRLWDYPTEWYSQQGFEYVIVSNGIWRTILAHPDEYSDLAALFNEMARKYPLVASFEPGHVPSMVTAGYPTVGEYHFPQAWIFRTGRDSD